MRHRAAGLAIALSIAFLAPGAVSAMPADCVAGILAQRDAAFAALQARIATMVSEADPSLTQAVAAAEATQVAMRAARTRRVIYLIDTREGVFDTPPTLSGLVNMDLTAEELADLRAGDPAYLKLEAAAAKAEAAMGGVDGMDAVRDTVSALVQDPEGLKPVLEDFASGNAMLEREYQACFEAD